MKKENINQFSLERFLSYNLHCGSPKMNWNPMSKSYLQGIRNEFCILNLFHTRLSLRYSLRFLKKLLAHRKKILFLGSPKGVEKEFFQLCSKNNHFLIANWSHGSFTNLQSSLKFKERPGLLFIFDLSSFKEAKEEARRLEIPMMAFVNSDESLEEIDYPIPAGVKSWKGGLFVYNLLFHLFSVYQKN